MSSSTNHNQLPAGTIVDLSDRAVFQLSGPDAQRYLNGQITQDVKLATTNRAVYTCITNAKGKLQGDGFVRKAEDNYWVDCPAELRDAMLQRIDMYLIADDAELVDISDHTKLYHIIADEAPEGTWACNRFGVAGYDTLIKPEGEILALADLEATRISNKVPRWGTELDETTLPPEALLEATAVSYNKGCYIGQEVISRIKSSGKVNRSLTAFQLSEPVEVPFTIPHPENPEAKPAGIITSQCQHGGQTIGLGYLSRKCAEMKHFVIENVEVNTI